MQSASILCCSSNSVSPSNFQRFTLLSTKHQVCNPVSVFSFSCKLPFTSLYTPSHRHALNSTVTPELAETNLFASGFIETGYICGVHGLQGEVRVKPSTDFPDLRFSKPGLRWLKQKISGSDILQEIELLEGRGHPGQNWIIRFNGITTVELAQKLVGSTLLVTDEDRPVLKEGEFYTHDLIGMRVTLKESKDTVGTVVSVYNSGASDLLHVRLNLPSDISGQVGKSKVGEDGSGPLVWVPFVEAIVPEVDLEKREMLITPPKGLLELNVRSDERSKKERRELEWKERKKFQRRLIAAKKKLCEMEQQHVFHGFRYGEKDQTSLLANQILAVNSKMLQQALPSIETPFARRNLLQILSAVPKSNTLKVSDISISAGTGKQSNSYRKLQEEGKLLTYNGKVTIFLVLEEMEDIEKETDNSLVESKENETGCLLVKALLTDPQRFVEIENRAAVPLVLICPTHSVSSVQELFSVHDYFAFNPEKVWFLEEEKLPVVGSSLEGHGKHKMLMKSPWEFLQRPVGSGGLISLLSSGDLLDILSEMGTEYIEVFSINQNCKNGPTLLGLVDSCKANVGIGLSNDITSEEHFDVIFSMNFMQKWVKNINKLQFHAALTSNAHVQKVDKDWIDVIPSAPNSYEFRCSIYSCLDACAPNKVCVLDSTD